MIAISKMTFSSQIINLKIPVSKTTVHKKHQTTLYDYFVKKRDTRLNRIKTAKRIPRKLKPQLKFRIGTVFNR